jgi:hypothetical protein
MAYWNEGGAVINRAGEQDWAAPAAIPSLVPILPRESHYPPRCPEIDCVRHLLPADLITIAELRAVEAGVGADRVLITSGLVSEETYVSALAASLGLVFEPLFGTSREHCPLSGDQLIEAANTGMLPLSGRNGVKIVVAPRLVDSRRLVTVATSGAEMARRIRLTSTARLHDFIARHSAQDIERRAVDDLRIGHPELSAGADRAHRLWIVAYAALIALTVFATPDVALTAVEVTLAAVFLAWTGLRLLGLWSERFMRRQRRTFSNDWLPTYSIIIALYREAAAVPALVAALRAFDYPALGSKLT